MVVACGWVERETDRTGLEVLRISLPSLFLCFRGGGQRKSSFITCHVLKGAHSVKQSKILGKATGPLMHETVSSAASVPLHPGKR